MPICLDDKDKKVPISRRTVVTAETARRDPQIAIGWLTATMPDFERYVSSRSGAAAFGATARPDGCG